MTIQDWLGADNQLGIDIWTKKYQYNNETFDSWLDRISNGDQEVRQLIMDKKFLFGGRILSNRGLYKDGIKTTYSNCFTGDTRVKTINGYKPIKDIKKGELVQTIDGSYQKVNETMSRNYDGDIYTFTSPQLLRKISCTPNHTFFTQTKEWIDAKSIYETAQHPKKNNYKLATLNYLTPINECSETIDIVNNSAILNHITAYWTKHREIQNDNNLIWTSCNYIGGNKAKGMKESKPINRFITIDNDLLYLFGRYLGDGSITMRDDTLSIFQIVFNAKKELEAYNRCKKIIEEHFGIICYDNSNTEQNTLVLKFDSVLACGFIDYYCGHKESKHFPKQYENNINIALGLIDSDGTVISSGALKVALANESLLNDLYNCLLNNNITCNSPKKKLQSDKIHYSYNINYSVLQTSKILNKLTKKYDDNRMVSKYNNSNNLVYIPINKNEITVTYYNGKVYNLSVEGNHTYIVEGLVAHNCYVIAPPEDNLESIFECASKLARTYSYGGGCGVDLSKLAPRGAKVNNTAKETSGAVSFMDLYNTVTGLIGQNGRRGALMLSISCEHPDLEEFISIKSDLNKITKANISVRITDDFMEAVQNRQPFTLNFTREATGEVITKEIDAYAVFHKLCKMNWDYAEPGMLFWDRIENWNLLSEDESFHYAGTNPLT